MAKGQKRSNREVRKPKAKKPTAVAASAPKGTLAVAIEPKKKN
jgi:hypothetical protein